MTENSLTFSKDLTFAEWESVGVELFRVNAAWQWWVGDWLNYGEKKYGKTYEQALEVTGKGLVTLQKVKSVAGEFESCRRRQLLSWSHHEACQALPKEQQEKVLDEAEQKRLSRNWVREKTSELKGESKEQVEILDRIRNQLNKLTLDELNKLKEEIGNLLASRTETT